MLGNIRIFEDFCAVLVRLVQGLRMWEPYLVELIGSAMIQKRFFL